MGKERWEGGFGGREIWNLPMLILVGCMTETRKFCKSHYLSILKKWKKNSKRKVSHVFQCKIIDFSLLICRETDSEERLFKK